MASLPPPTGAASELDDADALEVLARGELEVRGRIVDASNATLLAEVRLEGGQLRLGALARMSDAAEHPAVRRDFPVIAQSLDLAASPQLRNMASLGGNVLQRTRCPYFRDVRDRKSVV